MNDYWVVTENSTGKVIAHCGEEHDAMLMISFDVQNRTYRKQRFILDQVINVSSSGIKELSGQQGLPEAKIPLSNFQQQVCLPESQANPIITK